MAWFSERTGGVNVQLGIIELAFESLTDQVG